MEFDKKIENRINSLNNALSCTLIHKSPLQQRRGTHKISEYTPIYQGIYNVADDFGGCIKFQFKIKPSGETINFYTTGSDVFKISSDIEPDALIDFKLLLNKKMFEDQLMQPADIDYRRPITILDNYNALRVKYFLNQYIKNFDNLDSFKESVLLDQIALIRSGRSFKILPTNIKVERISKIKSDVSELFDYLQQQVYNSALKIKAFSIYTNKNKMFSSTFNDDELEIISDDLKLQNVSNVDKNYILDNRYRNILSRSYYLGQWGSVNACACDILENTEVDEKFKEFILSDVEKIIEDGRENFQGCEQSREIKKTTLI